MINEHKKWKINLALTVVSIAIAIISIFAAPAVSRYCFSDKRNTVNDVKPSELVKPLHAPIMDKPQGKPGGKVAAPDRPSRVLARRNHAVERRQPIVNPMHETRQVGSPDLEVDTARRRDLLAADTERSRLERESDRVLSDTMAEADTDYKKACSDADLAFIRTRAEAELECLDPRGSHKALKAVAETLGVPLSKVEQAANVFRVNRYTDEEIADNNRKRDEKIIAAQATRDEAKVVALNEETRAQSAVKEVDQRHREKIFNDWLKSKSEINAKYDAMLKG